MVDLKRKILRTMHCRSKALAENNLAIKIFFLSILLKAKKEWITSQLEHPADKWFFGEKLKTLRHWDQVDESQLISCVRDISLRTSLLDNSIEASAIFHLSWEIAQTISSLCCHHGLDICRVGAVFVSVFALVFVFVIVFAFVCLFTCLCLCHSGLDICTMRTGATRELKLLAFIEREGGLLQLFNCSQFSTF